MVGEIAQSRSISGRFRRLPHKMGQTGGGGALEFSLDAQLVRTALALVVLLVASLAVMRVSGIALRRDLLGSAARAVVQLALVAVVIGWLFANPQWSLVYVVIMLGAATLTAVKVH